MYTRPSLQTRCHLSSSLLQPSLKHPCCSAVPGCPLASITLLLLACRASPVSKTLPRKCLFCVFLLNPVQTPIITNRVKLITLLTNPSRLLARSLRTKKEKEKRNMSSFLFPGILKWYPALSELRQYFPNK